MDQKRVKAKTKGQGKDRIRQIKDRSPQNMLGLSNGTIGPSLSTCVSALKSDLADLSQSPMRKSDFGSWSL